MAMVGYTVCEAAVLSRIISRFPSQLNTNNAKAGDIDFIMNTMLENDYRFGFYLDYSGANEDTKEPFKTPVWFWQMVGIFLIRKTGDDNIETDLRTILDTLVGVFRDDYTLGGVTARARITDMGNADTVDINGFAFYWLPFTIEVIDR